MNESCLLPLSGKHVHVTLGLQPLHEAGGADEVGPLLHAAPRLEHSKYYGVGARNVGYLSHI